MKLFAFQPDGHGEQSMFVMAETEEEAKAIVSEHIEKLVHEKRGYYENDFDGWGTDYYLMTVAGPGQVIMNNND